MRHGWFRPTRFVLENHNGMLSIVIILMDGSRNWLKLEKTICNQINDSDGNNDSGKKRDWRNHLCPKWLWRPTGSKSEIITEGRRCKNASVVNVPTARPRNRFIMPRKQPAEDLAKGRTKTATTEHKHIMITANVPYPYPAMECQIMSIIVEMFI